ncbi:hypothetical protein Acsp01_27950 [Actinoplanes sp. NBRC 101535]|nr:hypothetical protein Acsp01_27950 [Actinoplanes sp. NBRC 101535]
MCSAQNRSVSWVFVFIGLGPMSGARFVVGAGCPDPPGRWPIICGPAETAGAYCMFCGAANDGCLHPPAEGTELAPGTGSTPSVPNAPKSSDRYGTAGAIRG